MSQELKEIQSVALGLRMTEPYKSARMVLDAAIPGWLGAELDIDQETEPEWLSPRAPLADLLREAFAPEIDSDFLSLLDEPDPEVRAVFDELWQHAVIKRFGRAYLGWD